MKNLLKEYGLNSDMQYFEIICISFHNGQRKQAVDQFKAMPIRTRLMFLKAATYAWDSGLLRQHLDDLFDNGF